ncbi:5-oxoprolinase subunit PxpB [Tamlana sp. I1]|uniref:5-oxoprolinase subunit PxpB n=1 Tax=Tamlana sp. I1 TaxID=2762061 RepID=UPI0018904088|nr:5-oxoprolinase subunit PxpB [Tamlana sp. I1]
MLGFKLSYKAYGDRAILVEWPKLIAEDILKDVLNFKEKIKASDLENIAEIRSAYQSLLIIFDAAFSFETEVKSLQNLYKTETKSLELQSTLWRIPVCYDASFGLDLDAISDAKNISKTDLIKRHTQAIYSIYFIGFLPGFLYLGGLDEVLWTPRKATPRMKIAKGAVAIGGNQTGIYPTESPGGWNIIGNSPIDFFNLNNERPCFSKAGDRIQFYAVSLKEYHDIKVLVEANVYQIEKEVGDD